MDGDDPVAAASEDAVYEYACHEGNIGMADILGGARVVDDTEDGLKGGIMRSINRLHAVTVPLCVTVVLGVGEARLEAQDAENPFTGRVDIRMGQREFESRCGTCHGQDATGNTEGGGPDLTTGRFRHASSDAGLFGVIREGIRGTAMIGINPDAADQVVWQIVTYLNSLSPANAEVDLPGSPATGQQIFAGKGDCARCHIVNGKGGRLGPDLSRAADRRHASELRTDLVEPNAEVDPRWWTMVVTHEDGSVIRGLRMHEDTFSLRIMDEQENLRSFSKSDIRAYERIKDSTMPGYARSLTMQELDDLVAYLLTLRRER